MGSRENFGTREKCETRGNYGTRDALETSFAVKWFLFLGNEFFKCIMCKEKLKAYTLRTSKFRKLFCWERNNYREMGGRHLIVGTPASDFLN